MSTAWTDERLDDLVARVDTGFLRVDGAIADLRSELRVDMAALSTELKDDMAALSTELKGDMTALNGELRRDMSAQSAELRVDMTTLRTELCGEVAQLRAVTTRVGIGVIVTLVGVVAALAAGV